MLKAKSLSRRRRLAAVAIAALLACRLAADACAAVDGAHFWLATSGVATAGPGVVAASPTPGETMTLYVWGRPTAGRQMRNLSLNLVASATGVDFVDGTYTVHNNVTLSVDRFEQVQDSSTGEPLMSDSGGAVFADALYGINAFTLIDSATIRGFGPICSAGEIGCVTAGDGEPAWLLGEFDLAAGAAGSSVDLRLQVGSLGFVEKTLAEGDYDLLGDVDSADHTVWYDSYGSTTLLAADGNDDGAVNAADYTVWRDHLGDTGTLLTVGDTDLRFGADPMAGDEPLHNALTDVSINLMGDDPDATITVASPAVALPEPAAGWLAAMGVLARIAARRRAF